MKLVSGIVLIAFVGVILCTAGCGGGSSAPQTKVTPEQFNQVWEELLTNYKKKKYQKKYTDEVLKKFSISDKEWDEANGAYGGMPAKVKAEYDKVMSIPKPAGKVEVPAPGK